MNKLRAWNYEFKEVSAKRLLAIAFCVGISLLILLLLPITEVGYQRIDVSQPGANASAIPAYGGYTKTFEDIDMAIPCQGPKRITPASFWFGFRFQTWQALGLLFLFMIPMSLATEISPYSNGKKAPFRVTLVIYVILILVLIGMVTLFFKGEPTCNPNFQYKFISSAPYWPSYVLVLPAYFMLRYIVKRWLGEPMWSLTKKMTPGGG